MSGRAEPPEAIAVAVDGSRNGRRAWIALAALVSAALALRLAFLIDHDEDIDALRFALGVERFDAADLRPHAPFYPVYVALAKAVAASGASPHETLGIVGAVAGAVVVGATALLAHEIAGRRAAAFAGALALGSPFLWLVSQKLMSDMSGVAFTTTALWLAARARRIAGAGGPDAHVARLRTAALVVAGLGLGVRLSYFPIAIALCSVVVSADRRAGDALGTRAAARGRDLLSGVVVWLVPLVLLAGPRPLVATTWIQAVGHFTRWGGTVVTVPSPSERAVGIAWGAWANALGGAWPDAPALRWVGAPIVVGLGIVALAGTRGVHRRHPELVAAAAAYFAWAALGQNAAYKPRHLLPLVPLAIAALGAAAERLAARSVRSRVAATAAVGVLALQWLADGARLVRAHVAPSPAAAIVAHLAAHPPAVPVLTRDLARMIADGAARAGSAASVDVRAVPSEAALLAAVDGAGPGGVLVTSEALDAAARAGLSARGLRWRVVLARPRSRYVDPLWSDLALRAIAGAPGGPAPAAPPPEPASP